jgi:hypothetical protein
MQPQINENWQQAFIYSIAFKNENEENPAVRCFRNIIFLASLFCTKKKE